MDISLDFDPPQKAKDVCKGLFYRVRELRYASDRGFATKREYRYLKRMSCSGCPQCDWMWDDMQERDYKFIDGGENGDVVQLRMTNVSTDYETGYVDDYDMEFVKV